MRFCIHLGLKNGAYLKTKTALGVGRRRLLKAGEAIRTSGIHVGNPQVSTQHMSPGVSANDHSVQLLHVYTLRIVKPQTFYLSVENTGCLSGAFFPQRSGGGSARGWVPVFYLVDVDPLKGGIGVGYLLAIRTLVHGGEVPSAHSLPHSFSSTPRSAPSTWKSPLMSASVGRFTGPQLPIRIPRSPPSTSRSPSRSA